MSVNKAQGQIRSITRPQVEESCFFHGQLYFNGSSVWRSLFMLPKERQRILSNKNYCNIKLYFDGRLHYTPVIFWEKKSGFLPQNSELQLYQKTAYTWLYTLFLLFKIYFIFKYPTNGWYFVKIKQITLQASWLLVSGRVYTNLETDACLTKAKHSSICKKNRKKEIKYI